MANGITKVLWLLLVNAAALSTPQSFLPPFGIRPWRPAKKKSLADPDKSDWREVPLGPTQAPAIEDISGPSISADKPYIPMPIRFPPPPKPVDLSQIPTESNKACSIEEGIVLRPVQTLEIRIKGKVTSNVTIYPTQAPKECKEVRTGKLRYLCYYQWGFTYPVAKCYGNEDQEQERACGKQCYENVGFQFLDNTEDQVCQTCLAEVGQTRHKCAFEAMNISMPCQDCALEAHQHYAENCVSDCFNVFSAINKNDTVRVHRCRECNDVLFNMMSNCGI